MRAFNTSYGVSLDVTATYHCFLGDCPSVPPVRSFTLSPRESQAFDDMIAATFGAPNSGGGVELSFTGPEGSLVVTSRLFSTVPEPTVGMFIPGLPASKAYTTSTLTSVRSRGPGAGFRTNAGIFNPNDATILVIFNLFADGLPAGSPVVRTVLPHSGIQVNGIYAVAGAPDTATENGVIVVDASAPVFAYAAVIDNETTDPYFVVGALDAGIPTSTPTRTGTLPTFTPSRTNTPGGAGTPTFTPSISPSPSLTPTGPTLTPSLTPSGPTATRTFSLTPTFTITGTPPTATPSFTPSLTPTGPSPTPTRTASFTITPSVTRTFTSTITPSASITPSPTITGTATFTPSITPTGTNTLTLTPTVSLTPTPTATPIPNLVLVGQGGTNFVPATLTVHVGDTVTWQWVGNTHSTTSGTCSASNCIPGPPCTGCTPWDSGVHNIGFTFTQTFNSSNTYTYFCSVHTVMMQGLIIVNP